MNNITAYLPAIYHWSISYTLQTLCNTCQRETLFNLIRWMVKWLL